MSSQKDVKTILKLIAIGIILLAAIYFASKWYPLVGALTLGGSIYLWLLLTPREFHSDPAGNGMAAAFDEILNIVKAVVLAIVFYIFMRVCNDPDAVLRVTMILLPLYFAKRIIWTNG